MFLETLAALAVGRVLLGFASIAHELLDSRVYTDNWYAQLHGRRTRAHAIVDFLGRFV